MAEWYYVDDGERQGPVSEEQLQELAGAGRLGPHTLVWTEGYERWVQASQVPGLVPEDLEPAAAPTAPGPASAPPTHVDAQPIPDAHGYAEPSKNSQLAVWSLVLAITSLACCGLVTGIPAVVLGHLALTRMKADPNLGGRGLAIAGLVIGYIGVAFAILSMILYATGVWEMPTFNIQP